LLNLPPIIQAGLKENELSMGHARALLGVKDENELIRLYNKVIEEKLSVRKTEELVKGEKEVAQTTPVQPKPRYSLSYEEQKKRDYLSAQFDTPVNIKKDNNGTGKIVIPFQDQKHLKEILALLER